MRRDMISCYGVGTSDNRLVPKALMNPALSLQKHCFASCSPSMLMPMKSSPKFWDGVTREYHVNHISEHHVVLPIDIENQETRHMYEVAST